MNTPKRYWWLQLPERYFEQPVFQRLEEFESGKLGILLYLKLMLLSLEEDGFIHFEGLHDTIEEEIAMRLHEDPELVRNTITFFYYNRRIERLADGSLYMPEVVNLTGSESVSAERVRKHREKKKKIEENAPPAKIVADEQTLIHPDPEQECLYNLYIDRIRRFILEEGEDPIVGALQCNENGAKTLQCNTYKEKDKNKYQYINKDKNKDVTETEEVEVEETVSEGIDTLSQTEYTLSKKKNTLSAEKNTVSPPTIDEVRDYCIRNRLQTNPDKLYSFYEDGTWYENGKLRDWKRLADSNFYR